MKKANWFFVFAILSINLTNVAEGAELWNFITKKYSGGGVYSAFFVNGKNIEFYKSGGGGRPGNGIAEFTGNFSKAGNARELVKVGPDPVELNYFRGLSSARAEIPGSRDFEQYIIVENTRCYPGKCNRTGAINRMSIYRSTDSGRNFDFQGFLTVNGHPYAGWEANDSLIYDPTKPNVVDTKNPTNNRFIYYAFKNLLLVSADGLDYQRVTVNYPIPNDIPVFASLAKTPYGYHMLAGDRWRENGVKYIRHLFSKDLINWKVVEMKSAMKNPKWYKGVHLRYDSTSNRLYAFSSCGNKNPCSYLAYLNPRDF